MSDPKLQQLTTRGDFRRRVEYVQQDLAAKGEDSRIAEAVRTEAQQREKVRLGYSKTMKSKHLAGADGKASAADNVDKTLGWGAPKRFWLLQGSSALAHGLGWGGLFGLSTAQRIAVKRAIFTLRKDGWPPSHDAYQVRIGWDPAHLELGSNWPA